MLYESNGDESMLLSIGEYFRKIRSYLYDLIEYYNYKDSWKMQLNMRASFISLTDATVRQILYSKSDNVEILHAVDTNGVIKELFNFFSKCYQEGLETKMAGSSCMFEKVDLLQYHFHKVTLKRGSSYIPTLDWIDNKKSTINPCNIDDNECFLYSIVAALNYQNISNHPERISNLTPFISSYNWDDIVFPAGHKDYSAFEKSNTDIALSISYIPRNIFDIRQCYVSKHNETRNAQANLLIITDGKNNWHYLATKSIPALLRGITSTHNGDFYCLNCFHSYRTLNALKNHEKLCEYHDYFNVKMPDDDKEYISSTLRKNSLRVPIIIYADLKWIHVKSVLITLILRKRPIIYLVDIL